MTKLLSSELPTNISENLFSLRFNRYLQYVFTLTAVGMGLIALAAFTVGQQASLLPSDPVMLLSLGIVICIFEYFLKQKRHVFILHSLIYGAIFGIILKNDVTSFVKVFISIPLFFLLMGICIRIAKPNLMNYKFFFLVGFANFGITFFLGWLCGLSTVQLIFSLLGIVLFTSLLIYKFPRLQSIYSSRKETVPLSNFAFIGSLEIYRVFDFLSIFVAFYSGIILIPLLLILGAFSLLKHIRKIRQV